MVAIYYNSIQCGIVNMVKYISNMKWSPNKVMSEGCFLEMFLV